MTTEFGNVTTPDDFDRSNFCGVMNESLIRLGLIENRRNGTVYSKCIQLYHTFHCQGEYKEIR